MTDEELMLRYRDAGNEDAFEALYSRYIDRMTAYIGRYVDGPETARDLAQETFMRIAANAGAYEPKARFTSWAYRIATNLAINAYRSGKRKACLSLNERWGSADADECPELMDTIPDGCGGQALDGIVVEETARDIMQALDLLPIAQRDAFRSVVMEGMSYAQASNACGCSEGTVKSRVHHARRFIRKMVHGF